MLLKVHKKQATTPRVMEIDHPSHIYILKLHDRGYLGKCISFPKGASLLKMLLKEREKKQPLLDWNEMEHIGLEQTKMVWNHQN